MPAKLIIEAADEPDAPFSPRVFQTTYDHKDYDTAEEAIAAVEARGQGSVVLFHVERNQPGRKPDLVYSSCGLWSFNNDGNGKWQAHAIHDGHGRAYADERPN